MTLEHAAQVCRTYGIKTFKCEAFEFEIETKESVLPSAENAPQNVITRESIKPTDVKSFFSGMPSDEELLFAATEGLNKKEKD